MSKIKLVKDLCSIHIQAVIMLKKATAIIPILRMIQFNVRNSILVIYHEFNST